MAAGTSPRSRDRARRMRRQAGFTLVELLVAMTLLALLSTMLFGGLRFGARSWERVSEVSEHRDAVASAHLFLRARLGETSAGATLGEAEGPQLRGGPGAVRFVAPWLSALGLSGLYRFTLWHAPEDGGRLMLAWEPAGAVAQGAARDDLTGERALLEGVTALRIGYFGVPEGESAPLWLDVWDGSGEALRLVRIDLAFGDPRRHWPALVVAPGG